MKVCTHSWHQLSAQVFNVGVPKLVFTCIHSSIIPTAFLLHIYPSVWPASLSGRNQNFFWGLPVVTFEKLWIKAARRQSAIQPSKILCQNILWTLKLIFCSDVTNGLMCRYFRKWASKKTPKADMALWALPFTQPWSQQVPLTQPWSQQLLRCDQIWSRIWS